MRKHDIGEYGAAFMKGATSRPPDPHTALHPILNLTTEFVVRDLERLVSGKFNEEFESDIVKRTLEERGVSMSKLRGMSEPDRANVHNKIVKVLASQVRERGRGGILRGTLLDGLRHGAEDEDVMMPDGTHTTIARVRKALTDKGHDLDSFCKLNHKEQDRITKKIQLDLRREQRPQNDERARYRTERTELHYALREWARGPLVLERPQGSSYHHLLNYDDVACGSHETMRQLSARHGEPQLFVVERDWARAFQGYELGEGESPLPFAHCCFEFRISGVRILAMLNTEDTGNIYMFCVYGRGGVWVVDDYGYWIGDGLFRPVKVAPNSDHEEFPRVAKMVWDNVRVACIMVDANVAETVAHTPGHGLLKKMSKSGRTTPRDHYIIDLKKVVHRHGGGGGGGTSGVKQRGHFRRGTWVHYTDADSGQVQYADDGGFWHSRTWRNWHFAGDPNNLITKEYRL